MDITHLIALARGDKKVDLVLTNLHLVEVVSGEIFPTEIAIAENMIVGIGPGYQRHDTIDLQGRFVCPGFIDAHVHVESSMVRPREFARAVVPHGVTSVVSNPHEIANVLGLAGIYFMIADGKNASLETYITVPACVPATDLATSGARLSLAEIKQLRTEPQVIGLGEVMDMQGVVAGDQRVLAELNVFRGEKINGHCPGLWGQALNAYIAPGISSDHKRTTMEEAQEKLRVGMSIFIREGSVARNLQTLVPMITPENERWLSFCIDDRQSVDLLDEGSIDHLVRSAIGYGVPPMTAIRMATVNPAVHFHLSDRGVVAPGRRADLLVCSNLQTVKPELVFQDGVLRASDGALLPADLGSEVLEAEQQVQDTVHVDWSGMDWSIPVQGKRMRVIGAMPDQLRTETLIMEPSTSDGLAVADPRKDLLKIVVIERHHASGRVGRGFVHGFGLKRGALASTVAHDHHNLMVIGVDDLSMETAARAVAATTVAARLPPLENKSLPVCHCLLPD